MNWTWLQKIDFVSRKSWGEKSISVPPGENVGEDISSIYHIDHNNSYFQTWLLSDAMGTLVVQTKFVQSTTSIQPRASAENFPGRGGNGKNTKK